MPPLRGCCRRSSTVLFLSQIPVPLATQFLQSGGHSLDSTPLSLLVRSRCAPIIKVLWTKSLRRIGFRRSRAELATNAGNDPQACADGTPPAAITYGPNFPASPFLTKALGRSAPGWSICPGSRFSRRQPARFRQQCVFAQAESPRSVRKSGAAAGGAERTPGGGTNPPRLSARGRRLSQGVLRGA